MARSRVQVAEVAKLFAPRGPNAPNAQAVRLLATDDREAISAHRIQVAHREVSAHKVQATARVFQGPRAHRDMTAKAMRLTT